MLERESLGDMSVLKFTEGNFPPTECLIETANLYMEVFAGHPWYEVGRCMACDQISNVKPFVGNQCPHCSSKDIESAYKEKDVVFEMIDYSSKPGAVIYLLESDSNIAGFAWGRPKSVDETVAKFEGEVKTKETEILNNILGSREHVFSISEIGVQDKFRGMGMGKVLVDRILTDAQRQNFPATVWTRYDTVLTPICLNRGFTQIYGPEVVINNGKTTLTNNVIIETNKQTPERVFFIKK